MWAKQIALFGLSACLAAGMSVGPADAQSRTLKISHQFPAAASIDEGDFRDRLARKFAQEVEERTNGELTFQIYPASSLSKPHPQFTGMASGTIDLSVFPLAYATGHAPAVGVALLPGLVTSYEQGLSWRDAEIGKVITDALEEHGIKMITWGWQAGAAVSKSPTVRPEDVAGTKVRGPGREVNQMLEAAGGGIVSIPSSETYSAMQSGVLDGVWTVPTSLSSFRLHEVAGHATPTGDNPMYFAMVPLLMSKATFDSLTPEQQEIILDVGGELEDFAVQAAREDDERFASIFRDAGAEIHYMDKEAVAAWKELARESSWKAFVESVPDGQRILDLAQETE